MKRLLSMCMFVCVGGECVLSIFISKSVWLGGFNQWRCQTTDFLKFSEYTSASEYIFLLTNFSLLYRYTHGAWKRKMYSLALIYTSRAVNVGAELNLWKCVLMRGPLPWFLFYIPLMLIIHTQYRRYRVIFARKYKTLQNVNIPGARFTSYASSGTLLFTNNQYVCS